MITKPRAKTSAKSSRARSSVPELAARIAKLQEEVKRVLGSSNPVITEALEATVEGVRRSLAESPKPTESGVLSLVFDELGHVVERKIQERFSVEDSFKLAKRSNDSLNWHRPREALVVCL